MAYINGHRGVYTPGLNGGTTDPANWRVSLTDVQKALVRAEYQNDPAARGYIGKTAAQIAELMNGTYQIANPSPQGTVPRIMTAPEMMTVPSPTELEAVAPYFTGQEGVLALMNIQDHPGVLDWINLMGVFGHFSQTTVTALTAYVNGTSPDPAWPAQIAATPRARTVVTGVFDPSGNPAWLELEASDVTAATGVS